VRKKDDNEFMFEIWSTKKYEPKSFIDSLGKHLQNYVNFKFGKGYYKSNEKILKSI
jgi:hypothetical protein